MSDEIDDILIDALQTPKSASHDGQSATARDAGEIIALADRLEKKQAARAGKLPFKVTRNILPGPGPR